MCVCVCSQICLLCQPCGIIYTHIHIILHKHTHTHTHTHDSTGLAAKKDLAEELSRIRLKNKKSPPPTRTSGRPRSVTSSSEPAVTPDRGGRGVGGEREEAKLSLLVDMGFADGDQNRRLLEQYKGDVQKVLDHVLQGKRS